MLSIVKQTIDFYVKNLKKPELKDLEIKDKSLLESRVSCFVTIYHKWEIRWSAWNIKEICENTALELIENTISAISKDDRFKSLTKEEVKDIKIRIDIISTRDVITEEKIKRIEPTTSGILILKKDYLKMACILPNINNLLLTWEDFIPVLQEKLKEKKFLAKDYIIYEIKTEVFDDM